MLNLRSGHIVAVLIALCWATSASAVTTYPDFVGFGMSVTGLQEETTTPGDPAPIFGLPTIAGTNFVWSPINFTSTSVDGVSDQTAGTFQGEVELLNKNLNFVDKIMLTEVGDYQLTGVGTAATSASVLAGLAITVLEVNNGGSITPTAIPLIGDFNFSWDTPNKAGSWLGTVNVDVQGGVDLFYGAGNAFATKFSFNFNNDLATTSELGTTSLIQKKTAVESVTLSIIPEPATAAMVGIGLFALGARRKRAC